MLSLHRSAYAGLRLGALARGGLAGAAARRGRAPAQRGGGGLSVAATRLNRYLALAGLGTRRSVEGLVRAAASRSTASSRSSRRQASSRAQA